MTANLLESIVTDIGDDTCEIRGQASVDIIGRSDFKRRFVIKGPGYDPVTGNRLSYLPPDSTYTSSIRLGNYCGGHEAEALAYQFDVNPNNALVTIWYAMSMQDARHNTVRENPEFVIHIEKFAHRQWVRIGSDTLCNVQHTPTQSDSLGSFHRGLDSALVGSGAGQYYVAGNLYKDWQKVVVDLSQYLYSTVRIVMVSSDCMWTQHYAYCYIVGDCQPMKMKVNTCFNDSTGMPVLQAPDGLMSYQWYRSKTGILSATEQRMDSSYVAIQGDTSNTLYTNMGHFVNYYSGDTMSHTQFKCVMHSLMNQNDPSVTVESTLMAEIGGDGSTLAFRTVCDSLHWGDTVITTSGTYTKAFPRDAGCDSLVQLRLTVNRNTSHNASVSACDRYVWHNATYTTSGVYSYITQNANRCYHYDTLQLVVNHSVADSIADTVCNSMVWCDTTYTVSGSYNRHLTTDGGCDSSLMLRLTVNSDVSSDSAATACDRYMWNGVLYGSGGDHTQTFLAANGCDSVVTLHLTLHNSYSHVAPVSYCDTFTWEGVTYRAAHDTAVHHYTAMNGCDSSVTYLLTGHLSSSATDTQMACDRFVWQGNLFVASTDTAVFRTRNVFGCDSTITLHLTINYSTESGDTLERCDSLLWWRNGVVYRYSTDSAYVTYTNTAGCDSTVWLNLSIFTGGSSESSRTVCDSMWWIDNRCYRKDTTVGTTLASVHGCDSIVTLHLTVNHSTHTILFDTAYGSYTWCDGNTYRHDTVVVHIIATAAGCDSVMTLHLFIKPVPIEIVNLDDHVIVVNHYPLGHDSLRYDYPEYRWYRDSAYLGIHREQDYISSTSRLQGSFFVEVPTDSSRTLWCRSNVVTIASEQNTAELMAWPSPLLSGSQLHIAAAEAATSCRLYDNQGRLCAIIPVYQGHGAVPLRLSSGVYMLTDGLGHQVRIVVY
ncbi:MAG: hypothetical protein K6E93_09860 [Bacteroidales bacterium]|nr:hypothetical protein [Bacteroidales bacterium]